MGRLRDIMKELERMIEEVRELRLWHRAQRHYIDAAACDIRETALRQAREAVLRNG